MQDWSKARMYTATLFLVLAAAISIEGRFMQQHNDVMSLDEIEDLIMLDRKKRDTGNRGSGLRNAGAFAMFHDDAKDKRSDVGHITGSGMREGSQSKDDYQHITGSGLRSAGQSKDTFATKMEKWSTELKDINSGLKQVKDTMTEMKREKAKREKTKRDQAKSERKAKLAQAKREKKAKRERKTKHARKFTFKDFEEKNDLKDELETLTKDLNALHDTLSKRRH